jgi:predicted PurR-regulated permease PerM
MGFGELLGLLLAVPVASCLKTFLDAWGQPWASVTEESPQSG